MALYEFRLPDIGEGVAEGEVVAWRVEPGEIVTEDQEMVEVMTDKATVTIGAPKAGRIAQLNAQVGEKVPVGSVLVVIDTDTTVARDSRDSKAGKGHENGHGKGKGHDNDSVLSRFQAPANNPAAAARHSMHAIEAVEQAARAHEPAKKDDGPAASAVGDIRESLPGSTFFSTPKAPAKSGQHGHNSQPGTAHAVTVGAPPSAAFFVEKPLATPATRKLARDAGVDLRRVPPTGPGGRVTQEDVQSFTGTAQQARPASKTAQPPVIQAPSRSSANEVELETRKPFVGLRRKIAERMRMAKQSAAHFTFVEEVEIDALMRVLERLRPAAEKQGVKLNYLPFIVKAVTLALKKHAILNSMLDETKNELVYKRYYHIGVATATDQGLMVPVLRDADMLSVLQIAREIQRISDGARAGSLTPKELGGSTFTITSLGKQGGLLATPVLNHPEVGILGVHRVKEKPVVKNGQIVIGNIMLLSLSFDHRIIDGHIGAAFAYDVIAYLENLDLLLLELA